MTLLKQLVVYSPKVDFFQKKEEKNEEKSVKMSGEKIKEKIKEYYSTLND